MIKLLSRFFWATAGVALAMSFTACDDDDKDSVTIVADPASIEVPAEGGQQTVTYTVTGMAGDVKAEAESNVDWVNTFNCDEAGKVTFSVDANEVEAERDAVVTLTCSGATAQVKVTQAAAPHIPFEITVKEIYDAGVLYSVVPEDPDMNFMSMVALKSDVDAYASDEEFFNDELAFYQTAAETAQTTLTEYLSTRLKKGTVEGPAYRLKPETEYYAYAYGMTADGERTTPIRKVAFKTIAVERTDTKIEISYDINGTDVIMTVTPDNSEQYYMYNMIAAAEVAGDDDLIAATQTEIDNYVDFYERLFGVPQPEAVQRFASKGVNSYDFSNYLSENTEYIGYAVPVDRLGVICGDVVSKKFTTGVKAPENQFTLSLTAASEREVTVNVKTDLSDHYVVGIDNAIKWEGMTDFEILARLLNDYQWQTKGGTGNADYTFYSLTPQTDYCIFVFGYVNGEATTPLYRLDVKTSAATHADITFHVNYGKYFDGTELADNVDATRFEDARGLAVLPVTLTTSGSDDCVEIYYGLYPADYTDKEKWPDSDFSDELLEYGYWQSSKTFFIEYDKAYTMIGFGATSDMALGEFGRTLIKVTRDGVSPYTEFETSSTVAVAGRSSARTAAKTSFRGQAKVMTHSTARPLKPSKADGKVQRTKMFRSSIRF